SRPRRRRRRRWPPNRCTPRLADARRSAANRADTVTDPQPRDPNTLLVRGLATAVPATRLGQADAEAVTRTICRLPPDQAELLHALYRQTGITTRHIFFDRQVVRDVLEDTTVSGNVFLPSVCNDELGPTTAQ